MRLYDGKKMVNIEMNNWTGNGYTPDWSQDFFESGKLDYSEYLDAYKVEDVDYCIEQAMDWKNADGDFYEPDTDPVDRCVTVEEISTRAWYSVRYSGGMDEWLDKLSATNKADAIKEAMHEYYRHLTRQEQRKVTEFYIASYIENEDGDIDPNESDGYTDLLEIIKVAERIREWINEWDADDCRQLCKFAGMEDEWDKADGETFESVIWDAVDRLGVDI